MDVSKCSICEEVFENTEDDGSEVCDKCYDYASWCDWCGTAALTDDNEILECQICEVLYCFDCSGVGSVYMQWDTVPLCKREECISEFKKKYPEECEYAKSCYEKWNIEPHVINIQRRYKGNMSRLYNSSYPTKYMRNVSGLKKGVWNIIDEGLREDEIKSPYREIFKTEHFDPKWMSDREIESNKLIADYVDDLDKYGYKK